MSGVNALRDLWWGRRARASAVAALQAFLPTSLPPDPAQPHANCAAVIWTDSYLVGFLMTVILLIARHVSPRLESDGLGYVQRAVFEEVTGLAGDLVAERAITLSLEGDADFLLGCSDALSFGAVLIADMTRPDAATSSECLSLWSGYVGKRLAR